MNIEQYKKWEAEEEFLDKKYPERVALRIRESQIICFGENNEGAYEGD